MSETKEKKNYLGEAPMISDGINRDSGTLRPIRSWVYIDPFKGECPTKWKPQQAGGKE